MLTSRSKIKLRRRQYGGANSLRWSERLCCGRPELSAVCAWCVAQEQTRAQIRGLPTLPERQSLCFRSWAFSKSSYLPLNGWDRPCVPGWIDVISKARGSFQEGRGRIKLEIFFYWEKKLNISGKVFRKMFLCFSDSWEHSDPNVSRDCARLGWMKAKWIWIKLKLTSQALFSKSHEIAKLRGTKPQINQKKK